MRLFHYSVDSYKGGEALLNDYSKHYQFAEPYILALQKGRETFDSVFLSTMYLSREVYDLKLRKCLNYQKDAVEGIFEYVRQTEFPNESVSRLGCVYYCDTLEEAMAYMKDDCISNDLFTRDQIAILEVEVEDSRVRRYDQEYYNQAADAIEKNDVDIVFELARSYFNENRTEHPLIEILSDGENHIVREIKD